MTINKIWFNIVKKLVSWGLNYLYNFIDKNKDGKLSKEEINEFTKFIKSKIPKKK